MNALDCSYYRQLLLNGGEKRKNVVGMLDRGGLRGFGTIEAALVLRIKRVESRYGIEGENKRERERERTREKIQEKKTEIRVKTKLRRIEQARNRET